MAEWSLVGTKHFGSRPVSWITPEMVWRRQGQANQICWGFRNLWIWPAAKTGRDPQTLPVLWTLIPNGERVGLSSQFWISSIQVITWRLPDPSIEERAGNSFRFWGVGAPAETSINRYVRRTSTSQASRPSSSGLQRRQLKWVTFQNAHLFPLLKILNFLYTKSKTFGFWDKVVSNAGNTSQRSSLVWRDQSTVRFI